MSEDELPEERRTALAPARGGRGGASREERVADLPGPGDVVDGKYRVEEILGAGGMGVVVAATHLGLGERVALKFMRPDGAPEPLVARLRREARLAFRIKSENVARLLDIGALRSGAPYLVMEYLDGQDLARLLAARGPLPVDEAVDIVLQACEAMAHAHGLGIVHRDLKPSNLFMTRGANGKPLLKVLDFGIAKATSGSSVDADAITSMNAVLGSPLYMSPEQIRGANRVDARCDIWALGVILHELVTGATPFALGPASAVCAAIAADPPKRLREHRADAPEELEAVVLCCLEKDPSQRYVSVGALAAALAPFGSPASSAGVERIASLVAFSGERVEPSTLGPTAATERPSEANPSVTGGTWNMETARAVGRTRARAALVAGIVIASLVVAGSAAIRARRGASGAAASVAQPPKPAASSAPEAPVSTGARLVGGDPQTPPGDGPPPTATTTVARPESTMSAAAPSASTSTSSAPRLLPGSHRPSATVAPSATAVATAVATSVATAVATAVPAQPEDLELRATSRRR